MRWLKAAGLAAFCVVWGFVGSLGAIWLTGDELEGDRGPRGYVGQEGPEGPSGPAGAPAAELGGGYVVGSGIGLGCPDGTSSLTYAPDVVTENGTTLPLCEVE